MSTRTAISAKRARETLVRLLFHDNTARYSYAALKQAYLAKAHSLHPDKNRHVREDAATCCANGAINRSESTDKEFIELKNAWEEYDKIIKLHKINKSISDEITADISHEEEASFTLFGVGCSFADSPSEREHRNEIMEQACRGWFSSGELATGMLESNSSDSTLFNDVDLQLESTKREVELSIIGDDLFIQQTEGEVQKSCKTSLVQDLDRWRKR
jgi:hypothetical protein